MIRLTVTNSEGSRVFETERTEVLLGRREGADLELDERAASRNHCLLRVENGRVLVVDLGSVNGTRVRGMRIDRAPLRPGESFSIGGTVLRVESCGALRLETAAVTATHTVGAPVPKGVSPDFGREVRAMLRKAPWYMVSLVIHVLVLMLLDLVTVNDGSEGLRATMSAVNPNDAPMPDDEPERYEPDDSDMRPEDPVEEMLQEPEEASPSPTDGSTSDIVVPEDYDPHQIGTGRSLAARIRPLQISPTVKDAGESINKGDLAGEQERARQAVERGIGRDLRSLRGLPKKRIVVIRGDFDKMEEILRLYNIPHTLVTRAQILRTPPTGAKVICINCARKPIPERARKLVTRVKSFVRAGGWIVTSDWSVEPYVTESYPEYVNVHVPTRRQTDTTIAVRASATSPLLDKVFHRRAQTRWWLEETSTFVRVRSNKVNVLVTSAEMQRRYGSGVVAFEFRPGGGNGRILHLMGHFYQKDGNRTGLVAMQRLILNYLRERFLPDK